MMNISTENWTYTHYFSNPLRAFVSIGAHLPKDSSEPQVQYLVTLTDKDYQELYQSAHDSLELALCVINEKYGHWDCIGASGRTDGEGCQSCEAH